MASTFGGDKNSPKSSASQSTTTSTSVSTTYADQLTVLQNGVTSSDLANILNQNSANVANALVAFSSNASGNGPAQVTAAADPAMTTNQLVLYALLGVGAIVILGRVGR